MSVKKVVQRQRPETPDSVVRGSAKRPTAPGQDDGQGSNEWREANIASALIRPGTKKWAWESKITRSDGKVLRAVIKFVPAFSDAAEGARRRLAKKYPL